MGEKPLEPLLNAMPAPLVLPRIVSKSRMGVYASSDTLFKGAIFGRDSLEVAEDLMTTHPRLVGRIMLGLASLQGEVKNDVNEEEPGKIVHEYRTAIVDGKSLKGMPKKIFEELGSKWGGNDKEVVYYGSVDATPHFLRTLGAFCTKHGDDILKRPVRLRSGHKLTMGIVAENALDWLLKNLDESETGLLAYQRRNPHGIENQVWKDSKEFYVHRDGTMGNHERPIASIEVQGLVYDALKTSAKFWPNRSQQLQERATAVRDQTINLLWQPMELYFALGTDYNDRGDLRVFNTTTANPAALLDTAFFDELEDSERQYYVSSIVERIMSPDFLTDAGIRSRALSEQHLIPFWDYHGSFVSWPKETYDIAKGLRRQGLPNLAIQLENRIINVIRSSRCYPEFVYVDQYGRVLAGAPGKRSHGEVTLVDSTNTPEKIQAWTVSARLAIDLSRPRKVRRKIDQQPWQRDLERQILTRIPKVRPILSPKALKERYPKIPYQLHRKP